LSTAIGRAGTAQTRELEHVISAAESTCFARDLGGTLMHVLVAAAGRALNHPSIAWSRRDAREVSIGILVHTQLGPITPVVVGAGTESLPRVRAAVDRLVDVARTGELSTTESIRPAVVVHVSRPGDLEPPAPVDGACVITASSALGEPPLLRLRVILAGDGAEARARAADLLADVAHLLECPYRRLV
jgi:2-oxoacid dehydrogenases acyltransferase (catalytic domain)